MIYIIYRERESAVYNVSFKTAMSQLMILKKAYCVDCIYMCGILLAIKKRILPYVVLVHFIFQTSLVPDVSHYMRRVHKIRSPRCWSHEEHFMQDLATLACSLPPPSKSPQNWARSNAQSWLGSCSQKSFSCQVRVACSNLFLSSKGTTPIDTHRQLWEVYGLQYMDVKNVQKWVREFMYRHPWWTAFWSAFSFSWNNCKSWSRYAWRLACCANGFLKSLRGWALLA